MLDFVLAPILWLISEVIGVLVGDILAMIPWRVWVSLGLVGIGVVAIDKACAGLGPTHPALLFGTGIGLVLSPVALFLWPAPTR